MTHTPPAADAIDQAYWYHTIELPDGRTTAGEYDHRPYLAQYGFPASMAGMSALDVGAADGFFSFEFERRGAARVVAVDHSGAYIDIPYHEERQFGRGGGDSGFHRFFLAHRLRRSRVEHLTATSTRSTRRTSARTISFSAAASSCT